MHTSYYAFIQNCVPRYSWNTIVRFVCFACMLFFLGGGGLFCFVLLAHLSFSDRLSSLEIFFSRITGLISTKLSTKHSWVMGIQVYSNECPHHLSRGDSKEIAKRHWRSLKIFFLGTTEQISTKLGTKHPCVMGNHVCSIDWPYPFPTEDNNKIGKIYWQTLKIILSRTEFSTKHPWVMGV